MNELEQRVSKAVDMLRDFEKSVGANLTGPENGGLRGWLKIHIHNIIRQLGREPYAIHEEAAQSDRDNPGYRNLQPGDQVFVQAHGNVDRDFVGTVIRVDLGNYLVFVRKPNRTTDWGCCAAFVTFRSRPTCQKK